MRQAGERPVLAQVDIPELPNPYHGKVRDNFDLADGRRIGRGGEITVHPAFRMIVLANRPGYPFVRSPNFH